MTALCTIAIITRSTPRPDEHQPWQSGPPCAYPAGGQAQLYQVRPRPQRATRDTRVNTLHGLLGAYGQPLPATPLAPGHDQALFNPLHRAANLVQGVVLTIPDATNRGGGGRQNNQQHAGPKAMLNGHQGCFAAAAFVFAEQTEVSSILIGSQYSLILRLTCTCTQPWPGTRHTRPWSTSWCR